MAGVGGTITRDRKGGRSGTEMNKLMCQPNILGVSGRSRWRIPLGSSFQEVSREAHLPPRETTGGDGAVPLESGARVCASCDT